MADPITPPVVPPADGNQGGNENGGGENKNEPKVITPEDHQKELDRIAQKTRKEEQDKLDARLKTEREQWEKDAKLSQEEKDKKAREQQEAAVAERELKITLRENRSEALEVFATDKLPTKLVDLVVDADKEKQTEKITNFKAAWNEALKTAVAEGLKGEAPKDPSNGTDLNKISEQPPAVNFL